MAITVGSVGDLITGSYVQWVNVPLPVGRVPGDLLICFSFFRTTVANINLASSWTTHSNNNLANTKLLISYIFSDGSEIPPVISQSGMTSGQKHMHRIIAFRGVDQGAPFGPSGAAIQFSPQADIGPLPAPAPTANNGAIVAIGSKLDIWTSVATLTGDGLNWTEVFESTDTVVGNDLGIVVDYAPYSGTPPTLTDKTFITTGGANNIVFGKIITLQAPNTITVIGPGAVSDGDYNVVLTPSLPPGIQAGDFLICVAVSRTVGGTLTSDWNTGLTTDYSGFYQLISYRVAQGGGKDTSPTITPVNTVVPQTNMAVVFGLRGPTFTLAAVQGSAPSNNAAQQDIGPITAVQPSYPNGIIFVIGNKLAVFTGVAPLSGDGLTWVELVEAFTTLNNDQGIVINYAIWTGGAPTITNKTFTVTGGAANIGAGQMISMGADQADASPELNSHTYKPFHIRPTPRPKFVPRSPRSLEIDPDTSTDFDYYIPFVKPAFRYRFKGIIQPSGYPARDVDADISGDFFTVKAFPTHRPRRIRFTVPTSDRFVQSTIFEEGDFDYCSRGIINLKRHTSRFMGLLGRINANNEVDVDLSLEFEERSIISPVTRHSRRRFVPVDLPTLEILADLEVNVTNYVGNFILYASISPELVANYNNEMEPFSLTTIVETWTEVKPLGDIWTQVKF